MKLKTIKLEEVAKEVRWWRTKTPFDMRFEHQYLSLIWGRHQSLMMCLPFGFRHRGNYTFLLQSQNMSVEIRALVWRFVPAIHVLHVATLNPRLVTHVLR
jgi:hypothetical protein